MSRIGRKTLQIPEGVKVDITEGMVKVSGPKGELEMDVRPEIEVFIGDDGSIESKIKHKTKKSNAYWGMTMSLIENMIEGVEKGYEKKLEIIGVGYRVKQDSPQKITFAIGYSHPVVFDAPDGITLQVEDTDKITVSGIDKQLVGLVAANIRKIRKPEPYKGKGIRYAGEIVRRKAGKSAKTAA